MSTYQRDLLERLLWTITQAGVGVLVVEAADWTAWWAVPIAGLLMYVKGVVAKKVGDPETAALP